MDGYLTEKGYVHYESHGSPIKAWTNGVPVEQQALQQVRNVAELPFIHKHIAVMPDVHWGMGATVGSVIPTNKAIVPAAVGVDIGCFRGDTKVAILNGRQRTMKEMAEEGGDFWIYSIDSKQQIVPGKARAMMTRRNVKLMKIVVSGGDEIHCTPDHEFMLRNGTYRRADELVFNDSLMALYRRWDARDGYEKCSNGHRNSKPTHVLVYEYFHGAAPKGHVIHHTNHNHFDNSPRNLELMTTSEHSRHHRKTGNGFPNDDPVFQAARKVGIEKGNENPDRQSQMKKIGVLNITAYMQERPEHFKESVKGNGRRGSEYLRKFNVLPRVCDDCGITSDNPAALRWHKIKKHGYNHKVVALQDVDEREDVYCLQVVKHHNFALAAGVFVHNCGMMAIRTSLKADQLPDNLGQLRGEIEKNIPHGRTANGGPRDKGSWDRVPKDVAKTWKDSWKRKHSLCDALDSDVLNHSPKLAKSAARAVNQLGTLGSGNHFIEICLDGDDHVWAMLHSGSRGIGNAIGRHFIGLAKRDMERYFIRLPDRDLSYLAEGSEHFGNYVMALNWAQRYALVNREVMMERTLAALEKTVRKFDRIADAVNCHHNYVSRENHYGENVWITRKGAVRARKGDMGIIPGSMGARSFIVRGLGNQESFHSCSHGAGRVMSRSEAKNTFSVDEHRKATEGVECRKDGGVIDETPGAYKDISKVMEAQKNLVEIAHTLKQVVCVKG